MDHSLPWDFPGKNIGVGSHFLLQGTFLIQGSNLGLLHWRWTLYLWSTGEPPDTHLLFIMGPFPLSSNTVSECISNVLQGLIISQAKLTVLRREREKKKTTAVLEKKKTILIWMNCKEIRIQKFVLMSGIFHDPCYQRNLSHIFLVTLLFPNQREASSRFKGSLWCSNKSFFFFLMFFSESNQLALYTQ